MAKADIQSKLHVNDPLSIGGLLVAANTLSYSERDALREEPNLNEKRLNVAKETSRRIRVRAITYRSQGHKVNGFIVEPRNVTGKLPCIIWNRGGSNDFGSLTLWQVFAILGMVANWGYIVIASQYSGNRGSEGKDEFGGSDVEDVLKLRDVLRRHANADISRIGMHGGSRGAMMTYLCLARVKWIRAAVTNAGPSNLERGNRLRPEMAELCKKMFGGSKAELRKRSAIYWADRFCKKTPLLMMHGTNDWRVSPLDSLDLSTRLLSAGIHHQLVLFAGEDHILSGSRKKRWQLTRDWFDRYVKDGEKLVLMHGK